VIEMEEKANPQQNTTFIFIQHFPEIHDEERTIVVDSVASVDEAPRASHWVRWRFFYVAIALLLVASLVTAYLVYLWVFPIAIVTIVPKSEQVATKLDIVVATGQAQDGQVPGRLLSPLTMSLSQTVPVTGKTHLEAQSARGTITFYNAALYPQSIVAGTLLANADGVQIVTDLDTIVPPGQLATNGQATASAHAVLPGPGGNIAANSIYGPCCLLNIQASNGAFQGGQEATTYQSVTQVDIERAVITLNAQLDQSATAALSTQIHDGEQLAMAPCEQSVSSDHKAGDKATQVQVTVNAVCTGLVYNAKAFAIPLERASSKPDGDYRLHGELQTVIQSAQRGDNEGTYRLTVESRGTWVYSFSAASLDRLKASVAGKSAGEAMRVLRRANGVQNVNVRGDVPQDVSKVRVVIVIGG